MKKIIYTLVALLISTGIFAQDRMDALRYSNYKISGTARSAAMGNAFGALGGDFSSLSINPAGLGLYRSGEFVFTPEFGKSNIDGSYLNSTVSESKYNFGFNNIGYVAPFKLNAGSESGLVNLSFGIGFNQLSNFSMNMLVEGDNAKNSILTKFTNEIESKYLAPADFDPFYAKLAYETFLIDYDEDADEFYNDLTDAGYGQSQRKASERRGHINEVVISMAANFNHKFYVGATLGIHDVYYKETTDLYEYDAKNNINYFNNLNFLTYQNTTGTGYNFKIGAIYKPTNELRLGLSLHTPTFYSLHDSYYNTMHSNLTFNEGTETYEKSSPDGHSDYHLETPWRAVASAAYVIGKKGLISIDYELVDYSTAKLRNGGTMSDNFSEDNYDIAHLYKSAGNIRIGGEYRVNNNISLRVGYENYASAFRSTALEDSQPNSDANYSSIAGGIGYKQGGFFFDVALKHVMDEENSTLYSINEPDDSDFANYKITNNNLIFTLGFKF